MISYGSISLVQPTAELTMWLAGQMPPNDIFSFHRPSWLGNSSLEQNFDWSFHRDVRVGTYFNPWGASRWSIAYVIVDDDMKAKIEAKVFRKTTPRYNALPFVMDDGTGGRIETDLWMLPAIPLTKIKNVTPRFGGWLLVLVDERYFWWEKAAVITVVERTTTWNDLYDAIAAALGITITVDNISSDYLFPTDKMTIHYDHLPELLDWTARSVGQKIVRTLDGNFYARSARTALALQKAQANKFRKYAGGNLELGTIDA